jgi:hypothetical protein
MQQQLDYKAVIKLHKAWADRFMIIWYLLAVALFAGISFLMDDSAVEAGMRTNGYILLAAILVIGAIWQAAGMTIARIHMLMEGIVPPDVKKHAGTYPDVITGA